MSMKNTKTGKKAKAMTKTGTDALSGGLSESEYKTETKPTSGYKIGTKNIPALFWNPMSLSNGKKATKAKKRTGND